MTVSDEDRKIGINVSIPFKHIKTIDSKVKKLGLTKRSQYIWCLIEKDLGIDV